MPFDELIQKIDEGVGAGLIKDEVVCQIGPGAYKPVYCGFFSFKPTLAEEIEAASMVVAHGGTGSVLSLIAARKRFLAVCNPNADGDHQNQFLRRLSREVEFSWTADLDNVIDAIREARCPQAWAAEHGHLARDILNFIGG